MIEIYVDGASRGNPGPAGAGGIILEGGREIARLSEYMGEATNNEAEYRAVLLALERVEERGSQDLKIYSDSELLVRQLKGEYKTRSANLRPLYEKVKISLSRFKGVQVSHISREENSEADDLANQAIDREHPAAAVRHPTIGFLSDFGQGDGWVGICKGVIKRILPAVEIIDIAHDIPSFDVRKGAFVLEQAVPFVPASVFLAVVDPGVGGKRRPLAVESETGKFLVGPDNGLLRPAVEALGGTRRAVEIVNESFMLKPVSETFHGRDIFAPVAAYLVKGIGLDRVGGLVGKDTLAPAPWSKAAAGEGRIEAQVIDIDRFGTARLNVRRPELNLAGLGDASKLKVEAETLTEELPWARTFSDAMEGQALLLVDSSNYVSVAVNRGSAAQLFRFRPGARVILAKP